MSGLPNPAALVLGADRPFGAEIVARLEAAGFSLTLAATPEEVALSEAPLDAFILNAPVRPQEIRFRDITEADFRDVLQAQLFDLVAAGQAAAARLKPGGRIVHVASRAHLGAWGGAHQMAAGAALVGMSRSMAMELAAQGIGVNVVAPDFEGGAWDTPEARVQLADTVAYLAGPGSGLISGETILVEQGRSLRMGEAARR